MWTWIKSWFAPSPPRWTTNPRDHAVTVQSHWRAWLHGSLERILGEPMAPGEAPARLAGLAGARFLALDQVVRFGQYVYCTDDTFSRARLPAIAGSREDNEAYLFTAGCDGSGYMRQRALASFAHYPGRLALALALIRTEDWVVPVQDEAVRLLHQLLGTRPAALFELTGLLVGLRERTRVADSIWPTVIAPVLADPALADARWNATRDDDPAARLFAYALVAASDGDAIGAACRQALGDRVARIALWSLREARTRLAPADALDIARSALDHPHASVRADALRLHAELAASTSRDVFERALFDPSAAPRRVAAYWLRAAGIDPLVAWRGAIDGEDGARARIALLALAESATADDAARVVPWLADPRAPVRIAALRALARAQPADLVERLEAALADGSRRTMRTALAMLQRAPGALTAGLLRRAHAAAHEPDTRADLANCAVLVEKWEGLELIVDWANEDTPGAEPVVRRALDLWLGHAKRRFTPLAAARREHLLPALARARLRMPRANWAEVDEVLRYA